MGKRLHFMTGLIAPLQVEPGSEIGLSRDHDPGYTGGVARPQAAAPLADGVVVRVHEELLAAERMPADAGDRDLGPPLPGNQRLGALPGRVRAEPDTSAYDTGVKVSDRQMDALPLTSHDWHGDWNLHPPSRGLRPGRRRPGSVRPAQPRPGLAGPPGLRHRHLQPRFDLKARPEVRVVSAVQDRD
jgi:hypothetical protein